MWGDAIVVYVCEIALLVRVNFFNMKKFISFSRVDYSILFGAVIIQHGVRIDFHQHRTFQFALNSIQLGSNLRA